MTAAMLAALLAPPAVFAESHGADAAPAAGASSLPQTVRVGLGRIQTQVMVSSEGPFSIVVGGQPVAVIQAAQIVTLRLKDGGIQVDDLPTVHRQPVRIVPVPPQPGATNHVRYKQRRYRGELEILLSESGRLSVVNVVPLEEYLLGVVPAEMPSGWEPEALKAQAVVSRTYAVFQVLTGGKYRPEGFHVTDDIESQVYTGVGGEQLRSNQAVGATRGEVVTHGGQAINAFYHSSSGGYTEHNENVWRGTPLPYLRAVPDPDNHPDNHRYSWTITRTLLDVADGMKRELRIDPGLLLEIHTGPLSVSGRPVTFTAVGSRGQFTLRQEEMRLVLKALSHVREAVRAVTRIPRQLFGLGAARQSVALAAEVHVIGANDVVNRPLAGAYAVGAPGLLVELRTEETVAADGTIHFRGGGWGHRVGMSQWGARAMAQQGKTYHEILTHYYTGVKVETR
jgi:stage II sporulation protein D